MNRSDGSTADYYVLPEGATQLQDLISHRNMNAQIGEIIRACYRYGMASHSDMLRDAKKIRFYAQAEVERLEKLEAASEQCGQVEEAHSSAWSGAPEWAEWLAQDKNGEWNFYDGQPFPNDDENEWWVSHADGNQEFEFAGSIKPDSKNENWKSTLQRRPK